MVKLEDRELRNTARKCVESEMRTMLITELLKKGLGFKEVEEFVQKERGKLRGGGQNKVHYRKHREIVEKLMTEKLRDCKRDSTRLRREKTAWLRRLKEKLGGNVKELERIKKEV